MEYRRIEDFVSHVVYFMFRSLCTMHSLGKVVVRIVILFRNCSKAIDSDKFPMHLVNPCPKF
jgi:hypothetical protein